MFPSCSLIPMAMLKLPSLLTSQCFFFFTLFTVINTSLSARTLEVRSPPHDLKSPSITFYMNDILSGKHHSMPKIDNIDQQLPFSKPLWILPPNTGIPNPGFTTKTIDFPGLGIPFPARATLEEMEFGAITVIDEALFEGEFGSVLMGKAEGVYVTSLGNGSSQTHMVAIMVTFANDQYKNRLRLFGLYHRDPFSESHVAVIGGTGKYENANGYAIIKNANVSSIFGQKKSVETYSVLSLNVYL